MRVPYRGVLFLSSGILAGVILGATGSALATRDSASPLLHQLLAGVGQNNPRNNGADLAELQTFVEVLEQVRDNYVEPVEDKALLRNAIRGMLEGLDPHSAYLDGEEFKEMRISTQGRFGGLGIEVQMQNGFVKVVTPIDDTPAAKAGLQAGDLIVRIDEKPVKGLTLGDAVKLMRGTPGSKISLTVVREKTDKPLDFVLTRAFIQVKSVKSKMLDKDFGYVRISQFSDDTGKNLSEAMRTLQKENGEPLKGLVLDLRNNPGGVLNAAVDVVDEFVEKGTAVSIKGRANANGVTVLSQDNAKIFSVRPGDSMNGRPIVVLVNSGSASASEIVAGALQDHRRAVIVGQTTFGKGSVQTVLPLSGEDAIKLTTARYYTPNGRSIQAEGIKPDVAIEPVKVAAVEEEVNLGYKEADLANRLSNESEKNKPATPPTAAPTENPEAATTKDKPKLSLAQEDYMLHEAFNLVRALSILQR